MDYFKSLIILTVSLVVGFSGCLQQDSSEIIPSSEVEQKSSTDLSEDNADGTLLEVSLTGSSRAERFLGSYDQIERLALDVVRNYGNKQVVTDLVLTQEGGIWKGTVPKLIVDFDYTITGHAYRPYDNNSDNWTTGYIAEPHSSGNKWLEIFQGQVQHPVVEGTNTLSLRLAPILDDRDLSVPRITRIQRPFQLGVQETANIEVSVDTVGEGADDELSWRFRAVDNQSLPVTDGSRGNFTPDSGVRIQSAGSYSPISSSYTAPDNNSPCFNDGTEQGQCPQKLQIRVSNLQEIGVSSHFTVYVTDNETAETTIDNNPVITSISAERVGPNQLQWTIEVSDDDPFDSLAVHWDYLFGEPRSFTDNTTDNLSQNTGRMQTVMEYYDSDDGMLLVTVCETDEGEGNCQYQNESSTSVEYMLIPHAFPEIVVCDETGCELPSRLAGTMTNPKDWYGCLNDGNGDVLYHTQFSPKNYKMDVNFLQSNDENCGGNSAVLYSISGSVMQDNSTAYVYPKSSILDYNGDNLTAYKIIFTANEVFVTPGDQGFADWANSEGNCDYNAGEWKVNETLETTHCWNWMVGIPKESYIHYDMNTDTIRADEYFPWENTDQILDCAVLSQDNESYHPSPCVYKDQIIVRDESGNYFEIDNNSFSISSANDLNQINIDRQFKNIIYGTGEFIGVTDFNEIMTTDNLTNSWSFLHQGTNVSQIVHDGTGDYIVIDDGNLKCSVDNFTSSYDNFTVLDAAYNNHDNRFYAVGEDGFVGFSENCLDWSNAIFEASYEGKDEQGNWINHVMLDGKNDFVGVTIGSTNDRFVLWTTDRIYETHSYLSPTSNLIYPSVYGFTDNYTVFDIDWNEGRKLYIGFIESEYGVTRIESPCADCGWSNWSGMSSTDNQTFVKIDKVVGAWNDIIVAKPSDNSSFIYISSDTDMDNGVNNWHKLNLNYKSMNIFEIHN